jgi:hypothetical protein
MDVRLFRLHGYFLASKKIKTYYNAWKTQSPNEAKVKTSY